MFGMGGFNDFGDDDLNFGGMDGDAPDSDDEGAPYIAENMSR